MNTEKQAVRKHMQNLRRQLAIHEQSVLDKAICEKVLSLPEYRQTSTLLCYVSCKKEADTRNIIQSALRDGKIVAVPKVTAPAEMIFIRIHTLADLEPGFQGILEPGPNCTEIMDTGLMLVPGTAFDRNMYRMGYGGGYYDRWLAHHQNQITTCGLAYDFQLLSSIPHEGHDRKMQLIVTPTTLYRTGEEDHDN